MGSSGEIAHLPPNLGVGAAYLPSDFLFLKKRKKNLENNFFFFFGHRIIRFKGYEKSKHLLETTVSHNFATLPSKDREGIT